MSSSDPTIIIDISSLIKSAQMNGSDSRALSRKVLEKMKNVLRKYNSSNVSGFLSKEHLMDNDMYFEVEIIEIIANALGIDVVKSESKNLSALIRRCTQALPDAKVIVSENPAFLQLVDQSTSVLNTNNYIEINSSNFSTHYPVIPVRIPDYLALSGNAFNGYSKPIGIGERLINGLFEKHGSIEDILHDPFIREHKILKKILLREKELVEARNSAVIPEVRFNLSSINFKRAEIDEDALLKAYKRFNFNDWIMADNLGGMRMISGGEFHDVVDELINQKGVLINTAFIKNELFALSITTRSNNVFVFQVQNSIDKHGIDLSSLFKALKPVLEAEKIGKVVIDAKRFCKLCIEYNANLSGLKLDPLQAYYTIDTGNHFTSGDYDLHPLAKFMGDSYINTTNQMLSNGQNDEIDFKTFSYSFAIESMQIFNLSTNLYLRMKNEHPKVESYYSQYEIHINQVLAKMEHDGLSMDSHVLEELRSSYVKKNHDVEKEVLRLTGHSGIVNQAFLKKVIYEDFKLIESSGAYSLKKDTLLASDNASHPLIQAALTWLQIDQSISDINKFSKKLDLATGKVYPTFNHLKTKTFRFSAVEPPVQGFPQKGESKAVRNSVKADIGRYIVSMDYSQFELKILAHLSQEPVLIKAFNEGIDIHKQTASQLFNVPLGRVTDLQRKQAKAINFGLIYGKGSKSLSLDLGVSESEAKNFLNMYFKQFPCVDRYLKDIEKQVRDPKKGFVETLIGRRIGLIESSSDMNSAIRKGKNAPMQGSAAEIMKMAMVEASRIIDKKYNGVKIINQIHDELVFDVPKELVSTFCKEIKSVMENIVILSVPLTVDVEIGKNWGQAKAYSFEGNTDLVATPA